MKCEPVTLTGSVPCAILHNPFTTVYKYTYRTTMKGRTFKMSRVLISTLACARLYHPMLIHEWINACAFKTTLTPPEQEYSSPHSQSILYPLHPPRTYQTTIPFPSPPHSESDNRIFSLPWDFFTESQNLICTLCSIAFCDIFILCPGEKIHPCKKIQIVLQKSEVGGNCISV